MKKVFVLLFVFLVGCGNGNFTENVDSYITKIKSHAESAATDKEGYIDELNAFTDYLETIDDEIYSEYVKTQIEANNMRLEALKTGNTDLITESSLKQAKALQIYDKLKESE